MDVDGQYRAGGGSGSGHNRRRRGSGQGRGGGQGRSNHGNVERVDRERKSGHDVDGPTNKRSKFGGFLNSEQRIIERIQALQGSTCDLPPKKYEMKKFLANTRLYVGNLAVDATETELKELFAAFGEVDEFFFNREKHFAFLRMDFRANAEKARVELDQQDVKGRQIRVRFAPPSVRVRVKNLGPMVSNELLELAFSVFGEIERAVVLVDEKGKSTGEGVVDYTRKNFALAAHEFCSDKCYFITADLRPVITELGDISEMEEGLFEVNIPKREYNKDREFTYYKSREVGPRLADDGSFEHEYGTKWKNLVKEYQEKEQALKEQMQNDLQMLQTQMEIARYDYETEMLREKLRQREEDQQRLQRSQVSFGGGYRLGGGDAFSQEPLGQCEMGSENYDGMGVEGNDEEELEDDDGGPNTGGALGFNLNYGNCSNAPLAPPPLPPQALMAQLQRGSNGNNFSGPTWEISPFARDQINENFLQQGAFGGFDQCENQFSRVHRDGQRGGGYGGGGGNRGRFMGGRGGRR